MTIYEQVIAALKDTRTIVSHISKLGKLHVQIEDEQLKSLLGDLISGLQRAHSTAVASKTKVRGLTTPGNLYNTKDLAVQRLVTYAESKIATRKPEWQILAEQHGWTPPPAGQK